MVNSVPIIPYCMLYTVFGAISLTRLPFPFLSQSSLTMPFVLYCQFQNATRDRVYNNL